MIWIAVFILIGYLILIIKLAIGFDAIPVYIRQHKTPTTSFTVIIPFRNEAKLLPSLLKSIQQLNYPKTLVQFLFVNDASSDASVEIIRRSFKEALMHPSKHSFNYQLLQNKRASNSPKKDAISTAIHQVASEWVLTTDADCVLPENWLASLDDFIQYKQPQMVVGPVNYKVNNTFFEHFQLFDFLSLQGSTIGGFGIKKPFLCNGANLAYKKSSFLNLNGFKGNTAIASGDDVFLLEKFINNNPNDVCFLKGQEAIVRTQPVPTFNALLHQRMRWAAKTSAYNLKFPKLVGSVVFLANLVMVLCCFATFLGIKYMLFYAITLLFKCVVDWFLLAKSIRFFQHQRYVKSYILSSFLYPFFTLFILFNTILYSYEWKERTFKQ